MDLKDITIQLCQEYKIKPTRTKGQNFLVEEKVYNKIIETAKLEKDDIVLEVGPGLGFLTERLALKVKRVIAVELDDKLVNVLKARLNEQEIENVQVVNEDILEVRSKKLEVRSKKYKIVANLPYNITSRFLRKFLGGNSALGAGYPAPSAGSQMTLLLQKEVAERITAGPGKMSLLAVSVQFYSDSEIIEHVPRQAFWPEPEVDSAIIRLIPHPAPPLRKGRELTETKNHKIKDGLINKSSRLAKGGDRGGSKERSKTESLELEKGFFRLARIGFSARRKMLKNNLSAGYRINQKEAGNIIKKAGFSEKIRAQELSVDDWIKLYKYFS